MFISLQQLEQRPVRFDVTLGAGKIEFDDRLTQASDLRASGVANLISHALGEIRVEGKLSVTMNAPCDRCLETASVPVERAFDLVYLPESENTGKGEDEVDEAAVEVAFYAGSGLELNDVLREVILLAVPMQVVCGADCKGICPVCGHNRNQSPCECENKPTDDRWRGLKNIKAEIGSRN